MNEYKATQTAAGKGKVVDKDGFSVCSCSGGTYKDTVKRAEAIAVALNNHERLVEALRDLRSSAATSHECRYSHSGGDLNQALARQEIAERKADELLAQIEVGKGGEL